MESGVLSTFSVIDVEAVLPARSRAVPLITWFAPSNDSVTGDGPPAMPDVASAHVNVTITSVLFQPATFGRGETVAVIVGGVRSTFTETRVAAELPAISTAVPSTTWLAPSLSSATGGGHVPTPERPSVQVNPTVAG